MSHFLSLAMDYSYSNSYSTIGIPRLGFLTSNAIIIIGSSSSSGSSSSIQVIIVIILYLQTSMTVLITYAKTMPHA